MQPAAAGTPKFPKLTGRVVDDAHVLSKGTVRALDDMLASYENGTTNQVVVVTLPSLQGLEIEDFGYQLGRYWGIGQKGKNNGVLLIVAPTEHKVRIEVGYGLEGDLTDAITSQIINGVITPKFKTGDIEGGVFAGTENILTVLGGHSIAVEQGGNIPAPLAILLIIVVLYICIRYPSFAWFLFSNFASSSFRSGSSRVGGGFSNGGFSGGGGSFGGGGSSGSW